MLPEMRYILDEVLPMLRETAGQTERAAKQQLRVWEGKADKPVLLLRCPSPMAARLPSYNDEETHYDKEKMFVTQLKGALHSRAGNAGAVPSVRSSMGCGIYPTLFGVEQELFPDKMPWIQKHLSKETLSRMTKDDLVIGREFQEGLDQMAYMKETLAGTGVEVYPLDLQGIIDIAHLVLGDQFFYELYDDPDFIQHLCGLCADAMIMGVTKVMEIIAPQNGYVAHYDDVVLPADKPLKLSEDTTTLISAAHIDEYAMPATRRVLEAFGGGYVHYCGKNASLYDTVLAEPSVIGLNFGNPEKHDMQKVLRDVAELGKVFYGVCAQGEGESRADYFRRVVEAQNCGGAHLLLPYVCRLEEREDTVSDWIAAGGEA